MDKTATKEPVTEAAPEEIDITRAGQPVSGIGISGNVVFQCTARLPQDQRDLVRWLFDYARTKNWKWPDLIEAVGFSSTTWYRIWTDKFRYPKHGDKAKERMPIDKQCEAIERYKWLADERDKIARADFVETSVWGRIKWLCERALIRQRVGFVYGESQIGKSRCAKEFAQRGAPQVTLVELPPVGGVKIMLREIARALHISPDKPREVLMEKCAKALDSSKLLIVDEVHRAFTTHKGNTVMSCLDTLRWLHDQTRCGMVLIGTNIFKDEMDHGHFSQYLKQLRRRGLVELQLPDMPTRDDLDLMARNFGLNPDKHGVFEFAVNGSPKAVAHNSEEVMMKIAKSGFGPYVIRLQDAVDAAKKKSEKPNWEHFVRASEILDRAGQKA